VADSLSPDQAVAQLEAAIEHGEAMSQYAPGGHPLFEAIDQARKVLSFVEENASFIGPVLHAGTRAFADVTGAIDGIASAEGTLRVGGDASFDWSSPTQIPWTWIAGGVGLLAAGYLLFRRRSA
jgi:hypothetical protein